MGRYPVCRKLSAAVTGVHPLMFGECSSSTNSLEQFIQHIYIQH